MFDLTGIAETGKQLNESFQQIIKLLTEIRDDQRKLIDQQNPSKLCYYYTGDITWPTK